MEPLEYRSRTLLYRNDVRLKKSVVVMNVRSQGNSWEQETPYDMILPYPTRAARITNCFKYCLFLGLMGLAGGILGIVFDYRSLDDILWPAGIIGVALIVIAYGMRHFRETWISFPCKLEAHGIHFCKRGPDSESFDSFTAELKSRIEAAQDPY